MSYSLTDTDFYFILFDNSWCHWQSSHDNLPLPSLLSVVSAGCPCPSSRCSDGLLCAGGHAIADTAEPPLGSQEQVPLHLTIWQSTSALPRDAMSDMRTWPLTNHLIQKGAVSEHECKHYDMVPLFLWLCGVFCLVSSICLSSSVFLHSLHSLQTGSASPLSAQPSGVFCLVSSICLSSSVFLHSLCSLETCSASPLSAQPCLQCSSLPISLSPALLFSLLNFLTQSSLFSTSSPP